MTPRTVSYDNLTDFTMCVMLDDINFVVMARRDVMRYGVTVDFRVLKITGDRDGVVVFGDEPHLTTSTAKAPVFLHGSIKWDGCSNWHFDAQDECMLHFCTQREASNIGVLLAKLYEIAAELMPDADFD